METLNGWDFEILYHDIQKNTLLPQYNQNTNTDNSSTILDNMEKMQQMEHIIDVPIHNNEIMAISTMKRRKLKMNKHHHRRRLKLTRALRKRLGKI